MKDLNRRSLFGWLAAAPLAVKGVASALAADGEIEAAYDAAKNVVDPSLWPVTRGANGHIVNTYAGGITWVDGEFDVEYRKEFIAQFDARTSLG
jgi:hypothetical protein